MCQVWKGVRGTWNTGSSGIPEISPEGRILMLRRGCSQAALSPGLSHTVPTQQSSLGRAGQNHPENKAQLLKPCRARRAPWPDG